MNKMAGLALVGLSLSLASCGGGDPPPPLTAQTQITGDVQTWTGTGTINLNGSQGALATAPVAADGTFTLTLPTGQALAGETRSITDTLLSGLSQFNCQNVNLANSNAASRGMMVLTLQTKNGASTRDVFAAQVSRTLTSRTVNARAWLYSDVDTRLSGRVNCNLPAVGNVPVDVSVDVTTGWNLLDVSIYGNLGFSGLSVSGNVRRASSAINSWITMDELNAAIQ